MNPQHILDIKKSRRSPVYLLSAWGSGGLLVTLIPSPGCGEADSSRYGKCCTSSCCGGDEDHFSSLCTVKRGLERRNLFWKLLWKGKTFARNKNICVSLFLGVISLLKVPPQLSERIPSLFPPSLSVCISSTPALFRWGPVCSSPSSDSMCPSPSPPLKKGDGTAGPQGVWWSFSRENAAFQNRFSFLLG